MVEQDLGNLHAEVAYSQERLNALEDEWADNYGDISKLYNFLFGIHNGFNIINIREEHFSNILFELDIKKTFKGPLYTICEKWKNSELKPQDFKEFISEILFIFYRIGIIGIKRKPELRPEFFYNSEVVIHSSDFDRNVKIYVHKALFSALKINSKEQEVDFNSFFHKRFGYKSLSYFYQFSNSL